MTIQQTERAREDESTPLARMKIFAAETNDYTIRAERIRPEIQALLEALTPQPSEEVVEAVARALCNCGHTIDRYSYALPEIKDYWRRQAEAAIAAMPSIPQESDAEVTEEMIEAGVNAFRRVGAKSEAWGQMADRHDGASVRAIYTAMTSARDKRG